MGTLTRRLPCSTNKNQEQDKLLRTGPTYFTLWKVVVHGVGGVCKLNLMVRGFYKVKAMDGNKDFILKLKIDVGGGTLTN